MPRLPTSLLLRANQENPLLPLLLKECRSLESARNELRWLRERALRDTRQATRRRTGWRTRLRAMCHKRSQGMPLQYILGDQQFGDLEILCRRGVLIPRSDTESYTYEAARLVRQIALETEEKESSSPPASPSSKTAPNPVRILDLCTGTGCIALLLHALLSPHFPRLQITGIDLSPVALSLARKNLEHNISLDVLDSRARDEISFHRGDVLARSTNKSDSTIPTVEDLLSQHAASELECEALPAIDLLISNPPYISPSDFRNGTTARSVRLFEPRLALVPPITPTPNTHPNASVSAGDHPEDIFYQRLLEVSLGVRARLTVLECGDKKQAERVVEMFRGMSDALGREGGTVIFTARIWPGTEGECRANGFHVVDGSRCVVIRRGMSL